MGRSAKVAVDVDAQVTNDADWYHGSTTDRDGASSRNTDESCHLGVRLFHGNAPAHKSLVAQQALCECEFDQ